MGAIQGSASGPYSGKAIPVGFHPMCNLFCCRIQALSQPFSLGGTSIRTALLGGIGLGSPIP